MGGKWESPTLFFSLFLSARARLDQTQNQQKWIRKKWIRKKCGSERFREGELFPHIFFREQEEEEKKTSSPPRALPAHGEPRALSTTMTVGNVDRPPPGKGSLGASGEAAERREQVRFGRIREKERERREKSAERGPALSLAQKKRGKNIALLSPVLGANCIEFRDFYSFVIVISDAIAREKRWTGLPEGCPAERRRDS